jgi:(p)ppGpp synthase/HD superfamily hydrolase
MSDHMISAAYSLASEAHKNARRKYSGDPYIYHPIRVAGRVATHPGATAIQHSAAVLHDTHEDPPYISLGRIAEEVHPEVAQYVGELTNPSKKLLTPEGKYPPEWPRAKRTELNLDHIGKCEYWVQVIKSYDREDNLAELLQDLRLPAGKRPPLDFVELYCNESTALCKVLTKIEGKLRDALSNRIWELRHAAKHLKC